MPDTVSYRHRDLFVDQQLALRTAATRLAREFDGRYGTETIERFPYTSYVQFATRSTVPNFLPLLGERFARQRLQALARVEGATGPWPGLAAPKPAPRSTPPRSPPWPNAASTSPTNTPSPGPTRSSALPTSSSPWAAATRRVRSLLGQPTIPAAR